MSKKKEIDVRLDEALYLAQKELKPYWVYSDPLFVVITQELEKSIFLPLNPEFEKKRTVFIFLDPTLLETGEYLSVIKTWVHRYQGEDLEFILVMNCQFPTFLNYDSVLRTLRKYNLVCPTVIDFDKSISKLFEINASPSIVMYDLTLPNPVIKTEQTANHDWVFAGESLIQGVLRDRDPGLPLEFIMKSKISKILNRSEILFSKMSLIDLKDFYVNEDHITPKKDNARITIKSELPNMIVLARIENQLDEKVRMNVYLDDDPVFQQYGGEDILKDDAGLTFIVITEPKLYNILQQVNLKSYTVTLEFPFAEKIRISLYSVLFFST